jgi:hypothetical protein
VKIGNDLHLFGSGAGTLHFMTREAAQKERKGVEKELARAKKMIKEEQEHTKEKDNEIYELKDERARFSRLSLVALSTLTGRRQYASATRSSRRRLSVPRAMHNLGVSQPQ